MLRNGAALEPQCLVRLCSEGVAQVQQQSSVQTQAPFTNSTARHSTGTGAGLLFIRSTQKGSDDLGLKISTFTEPEADTSESLPFLLCLSGSNN